MTHLTYSVPLPEELRKSALLPVSAPNYSDEEYMAQGFTREEVPLIRRHDALHAIYKREGYLKPRKKAEMLELVWRLGL